ncbi:MAG: polyribonucleotide nucleotidyltransferase [Acidobacteriota bacterium]
MHSVDIPLGSKTLTIETGRLAKQADGAALVRYGDTVVLVTACAMDEPKVGVDFFPLTVDYREYTYSAGKIPGGFFKREGRPSESEILTCRLIDRPLRPLFQDGYRNETQVVAMALSHDPENDPDIHAITGAGTALYLSDIPFLDPIAAVRVGLLDGGYIANPTYKELEESRINLVVAASEAAVVMVEAGAKEVSEAEMAGAIAFGHEQIRRIIEAQKKLRELCGKPKRAVAKEATDPDALARVERELAGPIGDALRVKGKLAADAKLKEVVSTFLAAEADEAVKGKLKHAISDVKERVVREAILEKRQRLDGRSFEEIRAISCDVGVLPRTHGSALFTRGETQALVTATLGTSEDAQTIDDLAGEYSKRFMLHYNFPPFSVGEVKMVRGPGRREVGHGALAERAVAPVIPPIEKFPYTVRIVSDILESNGSSSMASVCGATLALMDAGVPITAPVAGIAMGLVTRDDGKYAILTDIAGQEDHLGDMDFKVAGTRKGVTALQMDIKVTGVTAQILAEALERALAARLHILDAMARTIGESRTSISALAPRIISFKIPRDKIRDVIGSGGKTIRSIIERTGVKIDIEDDGTVSIASVDEAAASKAEAIVRELITEAEVGKTYLGKVQRLMEFGAFVEILPGIDGLLHVSEISHTRVKDVRDELKEGDEVMVKCISIDAQGRIRLSKKALTEPPPGVVVESGDGSGEREHRGPREHGGYGGGGGGRGGDRGRRDRDRGGRR